MIILTKIVHIKYNWMFQAQILYYFFNSMALLSIFAIVTFVTLFARVSPAPILLSSRRCQATKESLDLQFCKPVFPSKRLVIMSSHIAHVLCYLFCENFLSSLLSYVKLLCLIIFYLFRKLRRTTSSLCQGRTHVCFGSIFFAVSTRLVMERLTFFGLH